MRSAQARVNAQSSAHGGFHHWWMQRLTAVALVPLSIWFVVSVVGLIGADYASFTAWMGSLPHAAAMVLFIVASFYHAALGLQVVVEDYIHCACVKLGLLIGIKLGLFALGTVAVLSVLKLFFAV
jgi:succinate dehydrogenase / fumarate reductase membrane anchor subunit